MISESNNKVLILTGKAGQGHISIARSIEYWTQEWGLKPKVLDILPKYVNLSYKLNVATNTYESFFKLTDNQHLSKLMLKSSSPAIEKRLAAMCLNYRNYSIAIASHPLIHPTFAKHNIIILPDPVVHHTYLADPKPQHYISYWNKRKDFHFLGPLARKYFYNKLKNKTKQELKKENGFNPYKKTVVILAGGEWIRKTKRHLDLLEQSLKPDHYELVFICGKDDEFIHEMENKYTAGNFKFLGWKNDEQMNSILRSGDFGLCFTIGSAVTIEAGLCKLPLFVFDNLGGQERDYAKIIEKNGVGMCLKGSPGEKLDQLNEFAPQVQNLFENNLNKWADYLLTRPDCWRDFFLREILR